LFSSIPVCVLMTIPNPHFFYQHFFSLSPLAISKLFHTKNQLIFGMCDLLLFFNSSIIFFHTPNLRVQTFVQITFQILCGMIGKMKKENSHSKQTKNTLNEKCVTVEKRNDFSIFSIFFL